nr:MAG TPA: hypothetical protein [Caudoviricetes sp.]
MSQFSKTVPDGLLRESQRRVEALETALQDAYTLAYTSANPSGLRKVLEEADVPVPRGAVTRSGIIRVWEEGCDKFPMDREGSPGNPASLHVTAMLHHAASMYDAPAVPKSLVRAWLWQLANAASHLLDEDYDVLTNVLEEYSRAAKKHPGMTLECDGHTEASRLFALVEEIGEVAACLTYDNEAETGHGSDLESEVIQVIALALAWATRYLDDGRE